MPRGMNDDDLKMFIKRISTKLGLPSLRLVSQAEFLSTLDSDNLPKISIDLAGNIIEMTNEQVRAEIGVHC